MCSSDLAEPIASPSVEPTNPTVTLSTSSKVGRVFLGANVTPISLMKIHEGKTSIHSEKVIEPYLGKWLRYRGKVSNVTRSGDRMTVWFDIDTLRHLMADLTDPSVGEVLHIGDEIELVGKIGTIRKFEVELVQVEIIAR